jgi:WD40 repeat protein
MVELNNENILRQIFYNINLSEVRELIDTLKNKLMNYILIRILSYENIYKTIGKTQTWLKDGDEFFEIRNIALLPDGNIITLRTHTSSMFNIWDTNTYKCIKTIKDKNTLCRMILLPCGIIVTPTLDNIIKFRDINKKFKCTGQINHRYNNIFLLSGGKFMCFKWYEEEEDVPLNQDWCVSIIDLTIK